MPRRYFLFFALFFILPALVCAAGLININTADLTTLKNLPHVGDVIAQRIIDGRPYASTNEISNVKGIGGPGSTTYDDIINLITVGDAAPAAQPQAQAQASSSPTQTQTAVSSGGAGPPAISATITADTVTAAGAGTYFAGAAFGTAGDPLVGARYIWNFGDGGTDEGPTALHTYLYPGSYDVELSVGYNYSSATARLLVVAKAPQVALVLQADNSLLVANNSTQDLSIGGWSLESVGHSFLIPPDTLVHAQGGVRFAPAVIGFAAARDAVLRFPNDIVAATSTIAGDSPLHGEPVTLAVAVTAPTNKAPVQKVPAVKSTGQAAAVAASVPGSPAQKEVAWSYLVGLAAVIALGAVGAYYAHTTSAAVTEPLAEEFDIE